MFIIAIVGASGSGKTTLSRSLLHQFGGNAAFVSTDFYFRGRTKDPISGEVEPSMEDYFKRNFDEPSAVLLDLFAEDVCNLVKGKTIWHPEVDFANGTFVRTDHKVEVTPKPILIIEGLYTLEHPLIRELVDNQGYSIFVHTPSAISLARVAMRDIEARHAPISRTLFAYTRNVLPGYYGFVKPFKNKCNYKLTTWTSEGGDIPIETQTSEVLTQIMPRLPPQLIGEILASPTIDTLLQTILEAHCSKADKKSRPPSQ